MKINELLKIGEMVEVEISQNQSYEGNYLSKVTDMDDKQIFFSLPTEKGHVVPLRKGEKISINVVKKDGVYSFKGNIIDRSMKPYMHFLMNIPKDIVRLQRRNFVRIMLNLVTTFQIYSISGEELSEEIHKGVTINLSGGGMFIASTKKLDYGTEVLVNFKLTNGIECNKIRGMVRREESIKVMGGEKLGYGIEFLEIDSRIREHIISYLFELQRDRRSKGIEF